MRCHGLQQIFECLDGHGLADLKYVFAFFILVIFNQCLVLPALALGKPQKALKHTDFKSVSYVLATPSLKTRATDIGNYEAGNLPFMTCRCRD